MEKNQILCLDAIYMYIYIWHCVDILNAHEVTILYIWSQLVLCVDLVLLHTLEALTLNNLL
jgi:hypothetical protein